MAPGLSFLPSFLTSDFTIRRSTARDTLEEILVAELGDSTFKAPYLILRSSNNDLVIYSPYHDSSKSRAKAQLQFLKHGKALPRILKSIPRRDFLLFPISVVLASPL